MFRSGFLRGLLLLSCFAMPAYAAHPALDPHHVDGSALGAPIDLTSTWLLQQGDDPRYSDPNFDDSKWLVVTEGKSLASYGLKDVDHVWYRTHVRIPLGQKNLALMMRAFGGSFEMFVNGVRIGSSGAAPEGGSVVANPDGSFAIPDSAIQNGDVTIALRGSIARRSQRGAIEGGFASYTLLLLGPAPVLSDVTALYKFRSYSSNTINIVIELLIPLMALALALTLPTEREYLALVLSGTASVLSDILNVWRSAGNHYTSNGVFLLDGFLTAVQIVGLLEFVRIVLGLRRSRWWAAYEWMMAAMLIVLVPWLNHSFFLGNAGLMSSFLVVANSIAQILTLPINAGLPILALAIWWKRRNPDALLLFVPLFLQAVIGYVGYALQILNWFHLTERTGLPVVPIQAFYLEWSEVTSFLFTVALLLFLVLRTVRIARSRAAMASDLHAVQSVQEILLARASHPTPGFLVEHSYHPALEVGGDFFLVSPGPDGSLTAIVGDVSGKGLVAAMRVSMILGVLGREEQREPETILRNLNEALLTQGEMGFTTACCIHMERDGRYTIANAGHINPYIGGVEIPTPSSLPLGIVSGELYEQVSGILPDGETLVLMSDGVVEARSAKGELYGFDRLPQLTLMTASDIADVARRFGQEDDITVLTVACAA
jgi:sigma-B regulation protein RsbU (phosphoserine phosphatase)